jgi:hypothetical protein
MRPVVKSNGILPYPSQVGRRVFRAADGGSVTENSSPVPPDPPSSSRDVGKRLAGTAVGRLTDQARQTTSAAKAGRVTNSDGEPGVLDLTPLRELLAEFMDELSHLRLRDRIAAALRQAADIIEQDGPRRPDRS